MRRPQINETRPTAPGPFQSEQECCQAILAIALCVSVSDQTILFMPAMYFLRASPAARWAEPCASTVGGLGQRRRRRQRRHAAGGGAGDAAGQQPADLSRNDTNDGNALADAASGGSGSSNPSSSGSEPASAGTPGRPSPPARNPWALMGRVVNEQRIALQYDQQINQGLVRSAAARASGLEYEEFDERLQASWRPRRCGWHAASGPRPCVQRAER